jgi:hypothetical protein
MRPLILFLILVATAGWWYFVGGRKLDEDLVRDYYRQSQSATLKHDHEALCGMLSDNFASTAQVAMGPQRAVGHDSADKAKTCESWRDLFASWERIGDKLGGELQLEAEHEIHSIEFAADRKSAVVDIVTRLDVAGSIMNIRTRSKDVLIRRNGRVLMMRSDGSGSITSGG